MAHVKHIEWTKLPAIARVLNKENADHWIGIAAKHSKKEINELVKKHLVASGEAVAGGTTATHIKNVKFHDDHERAAGKLRRLLGLEKHKASS